MCKTMSHNPKKLAYMLLKAWLFISAIYYINNLFSPSYTIDYNEGTVHRVAKYIIWIMFTTLFCLIIRAYSFWTAISMIALVSVTLFVYSGEVELSALSLFITATAISFSLVPSIWKNEMVAIGRVVIYGGVVVGFFSLVELTVLAPLFSQIWASTESIRSVSTLYNPNNLGLYSGACLILLPFLGLSIGRCVCCGALIGVSFITSGSRTAWVALFLVACYTFITSRIFRRQVTKIIYTSRFILMLLLVSLVAIVLSYVWLQSHHLNVETANRGLDLHTGFVRLNSYSQFISSIDVSILLPDINEERTNWIQDNFYLVMINSFGIIGLFMLFLLVTTHFSLRGACAPELRAWRYVFSFYLIAGLACSQLNSFPNNQLFFISCGSVFAFKNLSRCDVTRIMGYVQRYFVTRNKINRIVHQPL
jgi:hypothetical protein